MRRKPWSLRLARTSVPIALVCLLTLPGCSHPVGPEDAAELPHPDLVSVRLEYLQPGSEFALELVPGTRIWRANAENVPVNYPPRGGPYEVRIFDPFIAAGATGGITANGITVGGEFLTQYSKVGTLAESALVFIDVNGQGHNAF